MKNAELKNFGIALLVLGLVVAIVLRKSFVPELTLFANDAPLGALSADYVSMKTAWTGVWNDLNWLGIASPSALPNWAALVWFLLGNDPVTFSKFLVPVDLLFLGVSLWVCLRQFGVRHWACTLAAIAAMLNMNGFSHAAWGLPSRCTAMGFTLLAIAALRSSVNGHAIAKSLLAGFCVASAILESYDVGAIYSLYSGVFAIFVVLAYAKVNALNLGKAVLRAGIVAVFAAVCAAAALSTLIGTQVQGVAGMQQDEATRQERWNGATMWSLPKAESLRVLVPGLFGYGLDAENGGNYWGSSGQTPGMPTTRHTGSGEYAGALVVVIAAFGIANGFRKKNGPFTDVERRFVIFFAVIALVSLLFAWGRHAPFYKIIYSLPFFSTIRNPMKFMHPFHMALLLLFGFGLEAIFRAYVKEVQNKAGGLNSAISEWWKKAGGFDKKWTIGSLAFCGLFLLGSFIYMSSRKDLLAYLRTGGFPPQLAEQIASFSYTEAMTAWVLTLISVLLVMAAMSGWFSGRRARYLIAAIGIFVTVDLIRANASWINYFNYKERYATNTVIDFLRTDSHEHRATARLTPFGQKHFTVDDPGQANTSFFAKVANQWLQHHFQYYNIQAIEPVQMPRPPEIDEQYFKALFPTAGNPPTVITRLWELTNTKYLVGDLNFLSAVAQQIEPGQRRFKTVKTFDMAVKPGITTQQPNLDQLTWTENPNGRFGIVEFTGALPRAKLYPAWQKVTDDAAALKELVSPAFNPQTNLLVHGDVPFPPSADTNFQGGVRITSYKPKRIELAVSNSAPAVLLYNDKLAPGWSVAVDGNQASFVRANYIMRGVPVPAGQHTVVMSYHTSTKGLYLSLAGYAVALAAAGITGLGAAGRKQPLAKQ